MISFSLVKSGQKMDVSYTLPPRGSEQNIKWNTLVGKECECLLTARPREPKKASGGHSSQEGRCLTEPIIPKTVTVPLPFYDFMRHPAALSTESMNRKKGTMKR